MVLALCFPSAAVAERAVVLAVVAESSVPAAERAAVELAANRFLTAQVPSIEVLSPTTLRAALSPTLRGCESPDCAGDVAAALSVDLVALLRVFAADAGDPHGSVSVALVAPSGLVYTAASNMEPGAAEATERALALADERRRRGPGPWLRVRAPERSRVRVDSGAFQGTPYLDRHEPGLHKVEVRTAAGEVLYESAVTVADDPASYHEIDLTQPAHVGRERTVRSELGFARALAKPSYFERRRSPWNWYLGVPVTLVGVGSLSAGLAHYVKRGNCVDATCTQVHTVNALSRTLLVAGTVLTGLSGAGFFALGVIRQPGSGSAGAMLRFSGRF